MSQSQKMALKVQEKLVTRLFLSSKLRQNLAVLTYGANDLKKVIEDFSEANPFISLKRPKNELQNLDWIAEADSESLVDHLLSQIRLAKWSNKDKKVVTFLVYQLDSDGYLRLKISELTKRTEFSSQEIDAGLKKLHELDPIGVGAFDLNECLLIQAEQTDFDSTAFAILQNHDLEKLAAPENWASFDYSKDQLLTALEAIRTLNPNPASSFSSGQVQYLIPDLKYQFEDGKLTLTTASFDLPEIVFDEENFANMQKNATQQEKTYFQKQRRDFIELSGAIAQREQTLLRLGKYVGKVQIKYLKTLDQQDLVSLNLAKVAHDLNLAVSTISRAVKDKYVECSGKIFSLRVLFAKKSVGKFTQNQLEQLIDEQIKSEDKLAPLSDDQIVANMQKNGIDLSRRTVAKYRKRLGIKNSYQRKMAGK